jgi:hypothetical protein
MASIPNQIKYLYGQVKCLTVQIDQCCNQVFDFVPYTNADRTVDLNTQQLLVGQITAKSFIIPQVEDISAAKGILITVGGVGTINNPDGIVVINNGRENLGDVGYLGSFITYLRNTDNIGFRASLEGNSGTGFSVYIDPISDKTGKAFIVSDGDDGATLFLVTELGDTTANSFIKIGGLVTEYLMADGSTSLGGGLPTPTNLGYTPSPTNGIVTSSTGTDATIPLGSSVNAGLLSPNAQTFYGQKVIATGDLGFTDSYLLTNGRIKLRNSIWTLFDADDTPTFTARLNQFTFSNGNHTADLKLNLLVTTNREYQLPDNSGTIALISDLTNYIPLTGTTVGNPVTGNIVFIGTDKGISINSIDNETGNVTISTDGDGLPYVRLGLTASENTSTFRADNINTNSVYQLPNASGTMALLEDLTLRVYDEGNGNGYRLQASNPLYFGNIGVDAVDFSYADVDSPIANYGATGSSSFATGIDVIASGYASTSFGFRNISAGVGDFTTGFNNQSTGYTNFLTGIGHRVTGMNATVVGQAADIITNSVADFNIGTDIVFAVGNGTIANADPTYTVLTRNTALLVRKNGAVEIESSVSAASLIFPNGMGITNVFNAVSLLGFGATYMKFDMGSSGNVVISTSLAEFIFTNAMQVSALTVSRSVSFAIINKTANFTLTVDNRTIEVTTASTQTLPTAVSIPGREYRIINASVGNVIVNTTSSQTIGNKNAETNTSITLLPEEWLDVMSNGSNWRII